MLLQHLLPLSGLLGCGTSYGEAMNPRILRRSTAQTFDHDVGDYLSLLGMYESTTGPAVASLRHLPQTRRVLLRNSCEMDDGVGDGRAQEGDDVAKTPPQLGRIC